MTKLYVTEKATKLPTNVLKLAQRIGCVNTDDEVMMDATLDEGGTVIYKRDSQKKGSGENDDTGEGWLHPIMLLLDGGRKVYYLEENPAPNQDGSDFELYQEIIIKARKGMEKDSETCSAISNIHDQFVIYLSCLNIEGIGSNAQMQNRRGRIQRAKLVACKIWREGKLSSDEKDELKKKQEEVVPA